MSSDAVLERSTPERRAWQNPLRICLIVLILSSVIDVAIWGISHLLGGSHPTGLGIARAWATSWASGLASGDSWYPMRSALDWMNAHPGGRLYNQLFFVDRIKFQYPPSSLLPFHVLSSFGADLSNVAMNRINCWFIAANALATGAFAFASAQLSPAHAAQRWQFAMLGAVSTLIFYPLMKAFDLGQVQVWINAMFAMSALAWLTGRKQTAGVLIGLICLLKPQFAMFMLWGLLRREWRFLRGWSAVLVLGLVASLAIFGLQNHLDYISVLRALSRTGESFIANQSFNGLLNRLYSPGDPSVWEARAFPPYNAFVYGGTLLSSAVLIAAALLIPLRRKTASGLLDFLGAALAFTMASPIAWEHHYGILPVIYVATMFVLLGRPASRNRSLALAALLVSYLISAHWMGGSWLLWSALVVLGFTLLSALPYRPLSRSATA